MLERLKTLINGKLRGKRMLEAATTGRRWPEVTRSKDSWRINSEILAARAEHYALNNPHGAKAAQVLTHSIVGTGIVPRSQHPAPAIRAVLRGAWSGFVDDADAGGLADLYGLQAALVRDMVVQGEGLASIEAGRDGKPQLQRLHPSQLDRSITRKTDDGGAIVQGVEFGSDGRRRAFHIRRISPGDALAGMSQRPLRVPASQIVHMFRPLVPGQVRGISWFAPVLLTAHELDQLFDALLVRAKVAALFVGSVTDADGNGPGMDGTATGSVLDTTVEPGTLRIEQPGKEIKWNEPPDSGNAPALATEFLRLIAAGVGTTYEQLTGDYAKVNYSSARSALVEFRRFIETVQHHTVVFQLCRPVWQQFMRWQVLKGNIPAASFRKDAAAVSAVKWLPPAWQWVDPLKDVNASVTALKNGIRSRAEIVAEQGYDVEDLDQEIAADDDRAKKLNLQFAKGGLASAN